VDAWLRPVAPGAWGELLLGGPGVARGYHRHPAATAVRFVPDSFADEPGARLYRTGDRVRWNAAGMLEFGGRLDDQVKVRGLRIEPGEVEQALRGHPDVADAVVALREHGGEPLLVGYVVAAGAAPGADVLRAHLLERLPPHMVPGAFVSLERLPRTATGKVDRGALPQPGIGGSEKGYVAPRTPTEGALAGIWADVLEIDRVGVHDNFFELGGHSLLAMMISSRVRESLGMELPLSLLFQSPTVAQLAAELATPRSAPSPPGLGPRSRESMRIRLPAR
ncbi:MAG TPA: phosphopantetheine-binding protein, partial [Longimicrobium sp.]|nr:phosphopantetheine-binding protein [Longimicrobium sp.]